MRARGPSCVSSPSLVLCIRHATDSVFPDDDMAAHDMAHAAYIEPNRMGVLDAY